MVASGSEKEKRDVKLEQAVAVDGGGVKAVLAAAAVSEEGEGKEQGGVVPGAGQVFMLEIRGLLVSPRGVRSGDVDVAVVTMACAKSKFPEVRLGGGDVSMVPAARLSKEIREALAAAGWGLVEGGGEGMLEWGRSDSMHVAKGCFEAIIEVKWTLSCQVHVVLRLSFAPAVCIMSNYCLRMYCSLTIGCFARQLCLGVYCSLTMGYIVRCRLGVLFIDDFFKRNNGGRTWTGLRVCVRRG